MTTLSLMQKCDELTCPLAENCPIGATPNMQCALKTKHMESVERYVEEVFPDLRNNPLIRLSAEMALVPLHRQLMNMYMAEHANPRVMLGAKVNPLLKEIRATIKDIQATITHMININGTKVERMKRAKVVENSDDRTGQSYYDMLLTEGKTSADEATDIDLMH